MGRKNKAISCTSVFTFCIAMLLDFSGVQEKAGKVFSLIEAFLPIYCPDWIRGCLLVAFD